MVLSTASPFKFCRDVCEAVAGRAPDADWNGFRCMDELARLTGIEPPEALAGLRSKPVLHESVVTPEGMAGFVRAAAQRDF